MYGGKVSRKGISIFKTETTAPARDEKEDADDDGYGDKPDKGEDAGCSAPVFQEAKDRKELNDCLNGGGSTHGARVLSSGLKVGLAMRVVMVVGSPLV